MEYLLRQFERSDLDDLWKIDQLCFPAGIAYSKSEIQSFTRSPAGFTLIAQGSSSVHGKGKIIGFIIASAKRRVGHIITIDVLGEGRRNGIGTQLLAAAEGRLRELGCHQLRLETAVDNLTAISFYQRHRYEEIKRISNYYSNGMDALVLIKKL